jgi:GTP-binding protein
MSIPTVAIVGRPNVGKSTLFNRIVGGREAIVHDQPGVTRDRKYGLADWSGRTFTVVDTGGYLPDSADKIDQAVLQQIKEAILESDLVVFLVDAKTGLTEFDKELAVLLKKTGRPVLLAVNKVDTEAKELHGAEFYALGFGDPIPIAAVSGRNTGDFLDKVIATLPPGNHRMIKVDESVISLAVVGRSLLLLTHCWAWIS